MNLSNLTIKKARELLDKKELSVKELVNFYLKNIEEKNKDINAYLEVYDDVLVQAEAAQKIIDSGESKMLTGIPLAVKDNILIKGKHASSASKILENYTATYDATVIKKLKEQGVVFLGRTNMDEFALGGSTENSAYGVTKNPSGGSAAAVATEMALAALGSDTGGSVRQPSSFCGVVGFKPTYGRVSRSGLMAATSSFDQIGSIGKTVEDAQILFDVIKGVDPMDSTSMSEEAHPKHIQQEKLTIGVPWSLIEQEGVTPDVKENFKESVKKLEEFGFIIKHEIS